MLTVVFAVFVVDFRFVSTRVLYAFGRRTAHTILASICAFAYEDTSAGPDDGKSFCSRMYLVHSFEVVFVVPLIARELADLFLMNRLVLLYVYTACFFFSRFRFLPGGFYPATTGSATVSCKRFVIR